MAWKTIGISLELPKEILSPCGYVKQSESYHLTINASFPLDRTGLGMHQTGFCFCILSLRVVASDEIGEDSDRVRVISTELLRTNGEGAPIQWTRIWASMLI